MKSFAFLFALLFTLLSTFTFADAKMLRDVDFSHGWQNLRLNKNGDVDVERRDGMLRAYRRSNGNRAEISDSKVGRADLHKEVWYYWRLRVVANGNGKKNLIVSQIHFHQGRNRDNQWIRNSGFVLLRHNMGAGCEKVKPCFKLRHTYQINHPQTQRKSTHADLGEGKLGQWYEFVVHAKWTWRNDGFIKVWKDGKLYHERKGTTYADFGRETLGPYFKMGAYTGRSIALVYGDDYKMGDAQESLRTMAPHWGEPSPTDLPDLIVNRLTWGERGTNYVHVYMSTLKPDADAEMDKRRYRNGSVTFYEIDAEKGLTIHRQARAPEERPNGWIFYLDKPHPRGPLRMMAESEWITGAPSIDQIVPRWETEPEPMPVLNLQQGQKASCLGEMTLSAEPGLPPDTLTYAQCGETQ